MSDYAHSLMIDDTQYNPFISKYSYSVTTLIETDYRITVVMSDGAYECFVYDSEKYGLFDGYYVKTRLGYESMDDAQIDRMYSV